MASNMGIPEKKTDTLLYIIIVCCIIAFPVIVLAGYTLEMTADKNGNIQAFEAIGSIGEYMVPGNLGKAFQAVISGNGMTRNACVFGLFGSMIAIMFDMGTASVITGEVWATALQGGKSQEDNCRYQGQAFTTT